MPRRCMEPDDRRADLEAGLARRAKREGDLAGAAWHMTAAAHLTTARRPAQRGSRALAACRTWAAAGRPGWGRHMARAFAHDRCIPRAMRRQMRQLAAGTDPGLGRTFPAGSPVFVSLRPQDIGEQIHFRVQPDGSVRTWWPTR